MGEVFLRVARDLKGFNGDESGFRSWVFMITHHRLVDERRLLNRRQDEPASLEDLEDRRGGDVEREAMAAISAGEVRRIIEGLASDQRDVLLLRILAGLTVEEVARIVGKRPTAVKALQRRGLAAIRRKIERSVVSL